MRSPVSNIARGHARDISDVEAMLARGLVSRGDLRDAFEAIAPRLVRFPGIDAEALRARVEAVMEADR